MHLLVDTDAFCKLGVAGLLEDAAGVFGTHLSDAGRLPALSYMLRKGRLVNRYGRGACNALVAHAEVLQVHPRPGAAALDPLALNEAIDPGEAQLFAAAAEFDLTVLPEVRIPGVACGPTMRPLRPKFVQYLAVDDMIPAGVESLTNAFLDDVPDHASWRTFTVSACAFPTSMGGVERHSHQFVERADWIAWRNNLHGRRGQLARLPSFGDCAIQHLQGVEGFDPRTMQGCPAFNFRSLPRDWSTVT